MNRIGPLIVLAALTAGCAGGIRGSGTQKTQSVKIDGAQGVKFLGVGEVHIVEGDVDALNVTTDDNLLPLLEISVKDGVLILSQNTRDSLHPSHSIDYEICLRKLSSIEASGSGLIDLKSLHATRLAVKASGAGDWRLHDLHVEQLTLEFSGAAQITASGSATNQTIECSGVGSFDGKALAAETARVSLSGTGSALVNVSKSLDAELSGVGSITYFGRPKVTQKVSGVGKISSGGS